MLPLPALAVMVLALALLAYVVVAWVLFAPAAHGALSNAPSNSRNTETSQPTARSVLGVRQSEGR